VAIDQATRWVFVQLKANPTAADAQAFLKALHNSLPDQDQQSAPRQRPGVHGSTVCQQLGIERRLTKPRTPRTNGMFEKFNGRMADVLKTHGFNERQDLEQTLLRHVALYNGQLLQSTLGCKTPMQVMKPWSQTHPYLLHKWPYDHPGCDSCAIALLTIHIGLGVASGCQFNCCNLTEMWQIGNGRIRMLVKCVEL